MKYSFLLPTRLRPHDCINSIGSIYKNASDKTIFEILLAFDEDDDTKEQVFAYCRSNNIQHSFLVTQRYGYDRLHAYINKLCEISNGEYVWLWNDDALLETKDWDIILEKHTNVNSDMVFDFTVGYPFTFPFVPKKYIDAMKHFSLNTHIDSWIEHIFKSFQLTMIIPEIRIFHNRHEGDGNSMRINYEEVNQSRNHTLPEFFSVFCILLRHADQNRIARNFPHLNLPIKLLPHEKNRIGFVGLGKRSLPIVNKLTDSKSFVLGYDIRSIYDEYTNISDVTKDAHPYHFKLTTDLQLVVEFSEIIFVEDPNECSVSTIQKVVSLCDQLQLERILIILNPFTNPSYPKSAYVSYCSMTDGLHNPPELIMSCGDQNTIKNRVDDFYKTNLRKSDPVSQTDQHIVRTKRQPPLSARNMPPRLQKYLKKQK